MTAFALKPTFTDRKGYLRWREMWSATYQRCQQDILKRKHAVKTCQRHYEIYVASLHGTPYIPPSQEVIDNAIRLADLQKELLQYRAVGRKMMSLLDEAIARKNRILKIQADVANQGFPLELGTCTRVDFHYNKGHEEYFFLPLWVIRAKGKSYYVEGVDANVPWTTHERANGTTKGVMRFPKCDVKIDAKGWATISVENGQPIRRDA